jgi:hypothetical protein
MDQAAPTILPDDLNALLSAAAGPVLVDLRGMIIYDALYAWCRSQQAERHDQPPAADGGAA